MAVLPLFHIAGLQVTLNLGLSQGATVVTMPRFDLENFLQLVQDYRVTRALVVPPIVLALARHPAVPRYDLSSLRLITSGAAPLGADLAAECADRLGCPVTQGYGMTELGGATHMVPERRRRSRVHRPPAAGHRVPGDRLRLGPGRRARASRGAADPDARDDARLPRRRPGHGGHHRPGRMAAHRGCGHRRPRAAGSGSSTGSRS